MESDNSFFTFLNFKNLFKMKDFKVFLLIFEEIKVTYTERNEEEEKTQQVFYQGE